MIDVPEGQAREPVPPAADEQLLQELTERTRARGLKLTGEDGLLGKLAEMAARSSRW